MKIKQISAIGILVLIAGSVVAYAIMLSNSAPPPEKEQEEVYSI